MSEIVTIGSRLIPKAQIALVEPFDQAASARFQSSRDFKARVVLLNRDSVLTEQSVEAFASDNGFRLLEGDGIATNPSIGFAVQRFTPQEGFRPTKAYATRLRWRDGDGNDQSKLLVSDPETVLAVVVEGGVPAGEAPAPARRPRRRRAAVANKADA